MDENTPQLVGDGIVLVLYVGLPLFLLIGAWLLNRRINRLRDRYLSEQEEHFRTRICMSNLRRFPAGCCHAPVLVTGSAVVANNYFVSFLAGFKQIFGGELKGYTRMCTVARRMAIVRMLQEAERAGANAVYNVRFETSTIVSANSQKKQAGGVELMVYGTAVRQNPETAGSRG